VSSLTTTADKHPAATVMSVGRMFAGGISWLSPKASWRVFGLGSTAPDASTGLIARLFGIRDFVLGAAVHHPDPAVRRAVLQAGVACDLADIASSLIAVRAGAPKIVLLTATGGAAAFVAVGLTALRNRG
jgi:hypothetical protein